MLHDIRAARCIYGEPRRRTEVEFTPELRQAVKDSLNEMHDYYKRGYTPKAKPRKSSCGVLAEGNMPA